MRESPKDHGSDRYGHVEASWFTAPPPQSIVQKALDTICPDCNVNVFITEIEGEPLKYQTTVAHDATCPWLTEREAS